MTEWVCPKCEDAATKPPFHLDSYPPRCPDHLEQMLSREQFQEARDRYDELFGRTLINAYLHKLLTEARDENRAVIGPKWALDMIARRAEAIGISASEVAEISWQ